MAKVSYSLHVTSEGTIRVMVKRDREYIGVGDKTKDEIFEAVKWALISKDAYFGEQRLIQDLNDLGLPFTFSSATLGKQANPTGRKK